MHLDLQRAAFGASFVARPLSTIQKKLHDNASYAFAAPLRG
jgi:hypothetical protein